MQDNQAITPKYWIGHNKLDGDVHLATARKWRQETDEEMCELFGEDWFMDGNYQIDLFEIKLTKVE